MAKYFITPIKNQALDVDAHNREEQKIKKHPYKALWAVKVLPDNRYIQARLEGEVVEELPADWKG